MAKSAKPAPIIIKSGHKFKGPGWNGEKVQPFTPTTPQKVFDPNKNGSIEIKK
jgi:hypothetical protein